MGFHYRNILVAIDGSQEAEFAFKKAIDIALRHDAKILLAHVIDTRQFLIFETYDPAIAERAKQHAIDMLEKYQKNALEAGVSKVHYEIEFGSPKIVVPKGIAIKHRIDLIVCGATGMNAMERVFIGSVSEHITRYANCDVLVVRTEKDS
jgi:nucleotide-binding universal stress UspA family protein